VSVLETDYETMVRAEAPVEAVWEEIHPLEVLIAGVPTITDAQISPDGRQASITGGLSRWPPAWRSLEARAELIEAATRERLRWTVTIPSLEWHFEGTFQLAPVASDETNITYRGVLQCGHPLASRLPHLMVGVLETHVQDLASRAGRRAANRHLAERKLG
jgi:carbon monoxide dehydrogenase subunit G